MDGNEQFTDAAQVAELFDRIEATADLRRLWASTLFVEQPIARDRALSEPVAALARRKPLVIDESDADLDSFPRAHGLGYAGVSAKTCKGVYRALLNAARAATWNAAGARVLHHGGRPDGAARHRTPAQPGARRARRRRSTSRSTVITSSAASPAPSPAEQARFAAAHPDLYRLEGARARVRIRDGRIALASLAVPGFAVGCAPDWDDMRPMAAF